MQGIPIRTRLTASQIKTYRETLLRVQGGKCALCREPIAAGEAVLDHDHKTGHCRAVLHRGCNAMLGHIENNAPRHKLTSAARLSNFCNNLVAYRYADYTDKPLHHTYRTEAEKRERRNARARAARKPK